MNDNSRALLHTVVVPVLKRMLWLLLVVAAGATLGHIAHALLR